MGDVPAGVTLPTGTGLENPTHNAIPVNLDDSGAVVASDVAGATIAQPDYALSDTASIITLTNPARKLRITVPPGDTANADSLTAVLMFCPEPPNAATNTLWLTTTISAPRLSVQQGTVAEFVFSTPINSIGVRGVGDLTTAPVAKIEVVL